MAHHKSESPLIVGTAGHIDHGKSTLIEALTRTALPKKSAGESPSNWGSPVSPFLTERLSAW